MTSVASGPDAAIPVGTYQHNGPRWMYRQLKIGRFYTPWFASPVAQLILVSLVCFLCPGMFNAVSGLGAGGLVNPQDIDKANVALYSTFAVVAFFAGSIANRLGLRYTLTFGGFGYFLYVASILSYNHNKNDGFLIFAGALLGVCAACLWTAQGAIMMSYPDEYSKGKFISWFWAIFNLGGVIGSLVPLANNLHNKSNSVQDSTYILFMVLMFVGFLLGFALVNARDIKRSDGTRVILMKNPSWKSELIGLVTVLKSDWYIIALFPMFFASNWFTTYQFNAVNLAKFNIRTRALNNVLYWISQMIGAFVFGYGLDAPRVRRSIRARYALVSLFLITMAIWGDGWFNQKQYDRADITETNRMDWTDPNYAEPMVLYMLYGFYDAAFQTCAYWFMGALTNNSRKLANFAGFYKGIQSAGAAIAWRIDSLGVSYRAMFISNWVLLASSLIIAAPVIWKKIKDITDIMKDLKFSDEDLEEVSTAAAMELRGR
ncbi:DUF895 domain membrane protein [Trichophyton verrucosum HKI 0517]|uniref:DUF895 domain membrane protein n=1 Tax=Trichophyton verrucosum (strain HKI 0517) TaxID=663202 RepID=D4DKY7_TRIVH|nr:DUF895 domain membrane protein [Trichophyton verrucosum HKI 0517]EFE37520.1 DUF895 domain membrane protein [Trichophyton verrucosum HKI 0517]